MNLPRIHFSRRTLLVGLGVLAVLVLSASAYLAYRGKSSAPAATPIPTAFRQGTVTRGDLRETVSATGPVKAEQRSDMSFLLASTVAQVDIVVGQKVKSGSRLMSLDTSKFELDVTDAGLALEAQRIAYNQLVQPPDKFDVMAARAAVARAAAQLSQLTEPVDPDTVRLAQQNLELQRDNLFRAQAARDQVSFALADPHSGVPDQQYYEAEQDVTSAELAVRIAEQQLINAQQGISNSDIAAARAALGQSQASLNRLLEGPTQLDLQLANIQMRQAEVALESARSVIDNAVLTAPFDGVIAKVNYVQGEQAFPGQVALIILDDSAYHVDVLVDEVDIARVKEGQLAYVKLDSYPDAQLTGHVSRIAPDSVSANGVVSYQVRIDIDNNSSNITLREGMTATVDVVVAELTNVLLVPNWAIRFDRKTGNAYVNIRHDNNTIEEIKVTIGQRGESMSELLTGLSKGDVVVVSQERDQLSPFGNEQNPQNSSR